MPRASPIRLLRAVFRCARPKSWRARSGGLSGGPAGNADIAALEHQLADLIGLPVKITFGEKGGTLTLSYSTLDQLDMICQRLSGERI